MRKQVFKIVGTGICLGIILFVIQEAFQIDHDVFMRGYCMAAPVFVTGAALFVVLYYRLYQRKMRRAIALLEAGKPEEYIAEIGRLQRTVKLKSLRNVLTLNLAIGYMHIKEIRYGSRYTGRIAWQMSCWHRRRNVLLFESLPVLLLQRAA